MAIPATSGRRIVGEAIQPRVAEDPTPHAGLSFYEAHTMCALPPHWADSPYISPEAHYAQVQSDRGRRRTRHPHRHYAEARRRAKGVMWMDSLRLGWCTLQPGQARWGWVVGQQPGLKLASSEP